MDVEEFCQYCRSKDRAEESFPFGPDNLVYKVNGRMFLLLSLETRPLRFNVKCHPEKAIDYREKYSAVLPGYHMNKKHWNTVIIDGTISKQALKEFVDQSYDLVLKGRK